MTEVTIRGVTRPLCLTVAALDKINSKCGGLAGVEKFLNEKDLSVRAVNHAWMLGLLLQEGEENRLMEARFSGDDQTRRQVPGPEEISHLMTYGGISRYGSAIWAAVNESMRQDIEAAHVKNVENAGQG